MADSGTVGRLMGIVLAALYAPLWNLYGETGFWRGFLYATLITGGVLVLMLHVSVLGILIKGATSARELRSNRTCPSTYGAGSMVGTVPLGLWGVSGSMTLVAGIAGLAVLASELPLWESFLAGAAVGGVTGRVARAIAVRWRRDSSEVQAMQVEEPPPIPSAPRWLMLADFAFYWTMLIGVMLAMLTLTGAYSLPIWPSFAVVVTVAGGLDFTEKLTTGRWYEDRTTQPDGA